MPELRHDPIQRRWVIVAVERGARAIQYHGELEFPSNPACPFCHGMEHTTPQEIYAVRPQGSAPNSPGWDLRVVPNKYPALQVEGETQREGRGMYDAMNGIGAHEVLIETPRHIRHMAEMSPQQMDLIFMAYRSRLQDLMRDPRLRYVLIFKNYGSRAGASIAHPHTQIIATPITPQTVAQELQSAREHFQVKERCLFCDILAQEMESGERVVHLGEHFVAICPYASRFPYEVMVLPRKHHHDFSLADDVMVRELARTMHIVLKKLRVVLNDPPFNFVFHTAPNATHGRRRANYWDTLAYDWHWHVEILPRLTEVAGFEWGTGFYINQVPPEAAAARLRRAQIDE